MLYNILFFFQKFLKNYLEFSNIFLILLLKPANPPKL